MILAAIKGMGGRLIHADKIAAEQANMDAFAHDMRERTQYATDYERSQSAAKYQDRQR